jgi:hypothetical protein
LSIYSNLSTTPAKYSLSVNNSKIGDGTQQ